MVEQPVHDWAAKVITAINDHTLTENKTAARSETKARRERFKDGSEKFFAPDYISSVSAWLENLHR